MHIANDMAIDVITHFVANGLQPLLPFLRNVECGVPAPEMATEEHRAFGITTQDNTRALQLFEFFP